MLNFHLDILQLLNLFYSTQCLQYLELLKNWEDIVPKKYISAITPIKIKTKSQKEGAHLVLKVDPSVAFAVEHEKEKIIKKINAFFGYQAIIKLEIIQGKIQNQDYKLSNNNKSCRFYMPNNPYK